MECEIFQFNSSLPSRGALRIYYPSMFRMKKGSDIQSITKLEQKLFGIVFIIKTVPYDIL
jgi:hypothetical protein